MKHMEDLKQLYRQKIALAEQTIASALQFMPEGENRRDIIAWETKAIENYSESITKIDCWIAEGQRNNQ